MFEAAQDYFTLLGMPRRFDIDTTLLEQHYYTIHRQYHPDRTAMNPHDKLQMLNRSIDINRAYDTLKSPLKRAQHLLALHGVRIGGEQDSVKPDAKILGEAMEWREALADADSPHAVEDLYRTVFKEREACMASLEEHCTAWDWEAAAQQALRLGYLEKILDEIEQKKP